MGIVSVLFEILCVGLIVVCVVGAFLFIRDSRQPPPAWSLDPNSGMYYSGVAADAREGPAMLATCGGLMIVAAVALVIIGIVVF